MPDFTREQIESMLAAATPGEWEWWNGCSWWRLGIKNQQADSPLLYPSTDRDGHPNLSCKQADRDIIAAAPDLARMVLEGMKREKKLRRALSGLCREAAIFGYGLDGSVSATVTNSLDAKFATARALLHELGHKEESDA